MRLKIAEADLEAYLLAHPDHHQLWRSSDTIVSQVQCGQAGVADIITCFDSQKRHVTVWELKAEPLKMAHVVQVARYVSWMREYLHYQNEKRRFPKFQVHAALVGPGPKLKDELFYCMNAFDRDLRIFLYELDPFSGLQVYPYQDAHIEQPAKESKAVVDLLRA
jgi:hypothetical protein